MFLFLMPKHLPIFIISHGVTMLLTTKKTALALFVLRVTCLDGYTMPNTVNTCEARFN
jgi:hypothetical protein